MVDKQQNGSGHSAIAKMTNLPVSTKHGVEISSYLRFKKTGFAKACLEDVIALRKPIPFKYATMDLGHKPGMGPGRYPVKAAAFFLQLIKSAEANALFKGLDINSLVITKLLANKAAIPFTGKRNRFKTKRTHIEIEVTERKGKLGADTKKGKKTNKVVPKENKVNKENKNATPKQVKTQ
jgi:ribosomal protein uL22